MVVNTLDDNVFFYSPYYAVLENALNGFGIISGCSISKGAGDWEIDVTSGTVLVTGTGEVSVSANGPTLSDASGLGAGESRIDLITADSGGTLAAVEGTGATNPDAPDVPANEVILGFVVVDNGDSTVADSDIIDIPALVGDDTARLKDGGSHALDVLDLTNGITATTATYTGDGSTSQGITGLGFSPDFVWIVQRTTTPGTVVEAHWTTDQIVDDDASGGDISENDSVHTFQDDRIISLDADGFTVDDDGADNHPNKSGQVYNFWAWGS